MHDDIKSIILSSKDVKTKIEIVSNINKEEDIEFYNKMNLSLIKIDNLSLIKIDNLSLIKIDNLSFEIVSSSKYEEEKKIISEEEKELLTLLKWDKFLNLIYL